MGLGMSPCLEPYLCSCKDRNLRFLPWLVVLMQPISPPCLFAELGFILEFLTFGFCGSGFSSKGQKPLFLLQAQMTYGIIVTPERQSRLGFPCSGRNGPPWAPPALSRETSASMGLQPAPATRGPAPNSNVLYASDWRTLNHPPEILTARASGNVV